MNRRLRIVVVLAVAVVLCCLAVLIFGNREPRYERRTLTEWINSVETVLGSADQRKAATNAVQHIGVDAIPFLLKWLQEKDSPLKVQTVEWLDQHFSLHIRIRPAGEREHTAMLGFGMLGREAKPAWPALIRLTYSPDPMLRYAAYTSLAASDLDQQTLDSIWFRVTNHLSYTFFRAEPPSPSIAVVRTNQTQPK